MTTLRAYSVTTDWAEASVIVFATTASQAKAEAKGTDWLCDAEWTDLRVRREPTIDTHAATYGQNALDFSTAEQAAIARELGWYELENDHEACSKCGRFPWRLVAGSNVGNDGLCDGCREIPEPSE